MAKITDRITALRSADLVAFEQPDRRRIRPNKADRDGHGHITWRLIAPALSGLAVVGVVVSLTLAAGNGPAVGKSHGSTAPAPAALPRYYVTINGIPPHAYAEVHNTATGLTRFRLSIPAAPGEFATIAAARSDRRFYIAAYWPGKGDRVRNALYQLNVLRGGKQAELRTRLGYFLFNGADVVVDGIAVSPDGTKLAAAVQIPRPGFRPEAEIAVVSLRGTHAYRTLGAWRAPRDSAFDWDPVWVNNTDVAFLLQDHLRGTVFDYTGRAQVRLLNTAAPGTNLLSSRVLATAGKHLGFFESAFAAPAGGPIIASAYQNAPALGGHGKATVRLVSLSPATGRVVKVLGERVLHYRSAAARDNADYFFQVFGLDASGQYALVGAPRLGMLSHGTFTALPSGRGEVYGAGW